ncbi:MAG: alpha/beta fold hydrolase [Rhodospirillaceae bacterium]|nr:alpha/beta fold hydrolase [Rhodospirillaceae bacterium]
MRQEVVLLPGLLCNAALFAPQIAVLSDVARCWVPSLVADSVGDMAAAVLGEAPDRFALAGLSMGGYVAQEILRRAPERVTRVALISTTARADAPEQSAMRRDYVTLASEGRFTPVTERLLPRLLSSGRRTDRDLIRAITEMAWSIGKEVFIRQQTAIINRPDGLNDLRQIAVPTALICGDADELTPPDRHREMAERIPGSVLTIIPACGHLATLEAPEAVSAALRAWLAA